MTTSASNPRVLVVGAGIGGLAAAIALRQRGVDVEVAEKRPAFTIHGVGLGQPANALRALRALGVLDEVLAAGSEFDALRVYDQHRRLIVDHTFLLGGDVPPMAALPRADLHRILFAAAERSGVPIRTGAAVDDLTQDADRVHVTYADGTVGMYGLVVGFDGANSTIRRLLFPEAGTPAFTGYAAWRLIVERPGDVKTMEFYQGIGSKTGVMPLTDETMYLFHVAPQPGNPWQDPERFHDALRERLAGYTDVAGDVRDALSASAEVVYSPIHVLLVPRPWHRGRVVLAGDAAHTVPPHLTQGAGIALEDALVLAEELSSDEPLSSRLETFCERRFARCEYVHEFALAMLHAEQDIVTAEQLEEARRTGFDGMDGRLDEADRIMDADIFAPFAK
ncbi:MAG: FAD-dependent monooxygenase [Streptosporangiales bacterium]